MHKRTRTAVLISLSAAFVILTAGPALAQPPVPLRMSTRTQAMGGANLLSAGPIEAGYFNPAALTRHKGLHVTLAFQGAFNQDFLDLGDFITSNSDYFNPVYFQDQYVNPITRPDAEAFRADLTDFGSRWYTLSVDPLMGIQVGSLAFSGYMVTRADIRPFVPPVNPLDISGSTPEIQARVSADLIVNGALGIQVGKKLHGGIGVRFMQRQHSDLLTMSADELDEMGEFTTKLADKDNWLDDPLSGFQVDVGGMVTLSRAFAAGGVIRGLVSGGDEELTKGLEPELTGGIMFKPLELLMGFPLIIIKDITLEANIQDLTNVRGEAYEDGLMDKLQLGAEVRIPFFQLRAGLNRGQLSAGLGFRFLVVDISAAVSTITDWEPLATGGFGPVEKRYFSLAAGIGF